ncbi:hypothetical protein ACFB49_30550 [Sphingomonas sp. DBB INV C78]|uniref:hypothetical protein n=1 Tax=Sphingomonas sp. DBB INV C78 TaxID=3349434 RepID=UPI0036D3C748
MAISVTVSDIAAFLALGVAIWSAIQTTRFNKRQNAFAETAQRLNELLITRDAAETELQRKADISANFVKIGKSNYRLKVFNRGAGAARNVRLEMLAGDGLIGDSELQQKFPLPVLEWQQYVELLCYVHLKSSRRAHVRLMWDDDGGQGQSKELWLDVY